PEIINFTSSQIISFASIFSLTIDTRQTLKNLTKIYRLIFDLPKLKYLEFHAMDLGNTDITVSLPMTTNKQISTIQNLFIEHPCSFNEFFTIISYTSQIRNLSYIHKYGNTVTDENISPMILSNLTNLSIYGNDLTFNELEIFISKLYSKLKVLSIDSDAKDMTYLNADRWEVLILKYFLHLTHHGDLVHIVDIFHALCGYCSESNIGLAHYASYIPTKIDTHSRQTYSNNFGNTHLSVGPKGIDGFILNIIFKPFVTRLIMMKEYLISSENVALYGECREKKLKTLQQQELNTRPRTESLHIFVRQDAVSNNGKIAILTRDLSDEVDLDRHESTNQQLQTLGTEDVPTTYLVSSTFSIKLKNARAQTASLMDGDDHSLYTYQEESLYVDLTLVRFGLLRLNFLMESCPSGSLPDPQFLNSLLILDSPVIFKAAYLVECAHFGRRCSLGQ
ncbi:unnamed protein product, partial [Rotaria sp. Silwood2]